MLFIYRFRIDQNYIGEPPAIEITITNLNDNIDKNFLTELLIKCGPVEEVNIYYHPQTKRHMGLARIVFMNVKSARHSVEKYNGYSVMGKALNVFHDPFGEECKRLLDDATSGKPKPPPIVIPNNSGIHGTSSHVPPYIDENLTQIPPVPIHHLPGSARLHSELITTEENWDKFDHRHDDLSKSKDEYSWDAEEHRNYRYDKKDSRKWDKEKKHHHYHHKSEKERERRPERSDKDKRSSYSSSKKSSYGNFFFQKFSILLIVFY